MASSRTSRASRASRTPANPLERRSLRDALQSWFWQCRRGWRASVRELCHRPTGSLLTCLVIGVALALPGNAYVFLKNLEQVFSGWEQSTGLTLFLRTDLGAEAAAELSERLGREYPELGFQLISPEQALEEFQALAGVGETLELLEENPLPALLETRLPPSGGVADHRRLAQELQNLPEVDYARYERGWRERLEQLHKVARRLTGALLGVLSLVVLLIVGNTIRLGVYARLEELEISLLFGADGAFMRRPFLYSGMLYGILGGLLAWLLTSILVGALNGPLTELAELQASDFRLRGLQFHEGLGITALGAALGTIGATLSVHRQVQEIEKRELSK